MNELIYDKFERYQKGMMTTDETRSFETELKENTEMRAEYHKYRMAVMAIETTIESDLRQQFKSWDQDQTGSGRGQIISMVGRWATRVAAFALLAVLAIGAYQNHQLNQLVEQGLFFAFTVETSRSDSSKTVTEAEGQLELADDFFGNGDHKKALELYRTIQTDERAPIRIKQKAQFHEALSLYHLEGRHPSFDHLLNVIAEDDGHPYQKKAVEFRQHLDKILVRLIKG